MGTPVPSPAQSIVEQRILENFIDATQPLEISGNAGTDPVAQEAADARWEEAARMADEDARLFLGHDKFMQKSLESALLRLQANRIPN